MTNTLGLFRRSAPPSLSRSRSSLALPLRAQSAGPIDPRLYSALSWRNLGPFRGGRIAAVTGRDRAARRLLHRTARRRRVEDDERRRDLVPDLRRDQGRLVDRSGRGRAVGSERRSTSARATSSPAAAINEGNGVYKSTDAGRTWRHLGLDATKQIPSMSVDPHDPNIVLIAAQGDVHVKSRDRGVYRSTDGGATWTQTLFVDDSTGAQKIARAFDTPNVRLRDDRRALHVAAAARRWSAEAAAAAAADRTDEHEALQVRRRRRDVEGDHGRRTSRASHGQDVGRRGQQHERAARLRHRRLGALPLRRRRRDLAARWPPTIREFETARAATTAASTSIRRTPTSSTRSTRRATSRPTAARPSPASRARPAATIRSRCGSIRPTGSACSSATTRARSSRSTAAARGARGTTSPPTRSITSRSTTRFRTGSTARSRTPAPSARAFAATSARSPRSIGIRSRAGSGARSSPIRSTRTPSTRAARAFSRSRIRASSGST